jgi:hypothetical protein
LIDAFRILGTFNDPLSLTQKFNLAAGNTGTTIPIQPDTKLGLLNPHDMAAILEALLNEQMNQ